MGMEIPRRRLPTEAEKVEGGMEGRQSSLADIMDKDEKKVLRLQRPKHGRVVAPVVNPHNNDDAGDLENEMKYEQDQEQKKEMEEIEKEEEESETGHRDSMAYGSFSAFYQGALTMAGGHVNLLVISAGFFLIGLILCLAAFNDPCGCEDYLLVRLIDRDSLMVVVEEDEGERIGLLQHHQMERSDLYKTSEQSYVYIQRESESDDYSVII